MDVGWIFTMTGTCEPDNRAFVLHTNYIFLDILSYCKFLKIVIEYGRLVVTL
jgi:hypothetical protein